eukprot:TRINITY_DN4084_c0_g1_i2.p1 TRINITY_DN4084_c0_g1~~TRINITY_DN4084_c0_g1_i2.p1  ORF type:complete len:114 (+),score=6.74 TRINITY_DN4084_c0_g1_i2:349-690(+)
MLFLIDHGCSLNLKNCLGDTPLHRAVWRGQKEAVQLLTDQREIALSEFNNESKRPIDLVRDTQIGVLLRESIQYQSRRDNMSDSEGDEPEDSGGHESNGWSEDESSDSREELR